MTFECVIRTHVGRRRKLNEDSVIGMSDRGLWAVADGMGGHEAGEVASAKVVEAIGQVAAAADVNETARNAITALKAVNHALVELGNEGGQHKTIGSTVVGLAIAQGQYRCFWAGDSRAYRIRDSAIAQLSRDHSLVQDLVKAGVLDAADAESHPNANVITRAVGAAEDLDVETVGGIAFSGDIFLIASDGLTREVSQVEILAALISRTLEQAADHLLDMVLVRGAPDNVSLILIKVE